MDLSNFSREEKTVIFVMGILEDFVDLGILFPGKLRMTEGGFELLTEMKKEGFEPTEEEITSAMEVIQRG